MSWPKKDAWMKLDFSAPFVDVDQTLLFLKADFTAHTWSICSKRIHLETCWATSASINRMVARPPSLFAFELPCLRNIKSIAKIVNTFPELGRFGRSGGILLFWFGSILHSPTMFWQFQILPKAWGLGFQTHPWRLLWMPKAEESGCNRLVLRGLRAWGKTRVQQNASGFRNTPRISDLTGPAVWAFLRLGLKRTIPVLLSLVPTLVEKRMDNKCQPCFNVFAKHGEFRLLQTWFAAKWSWQFGTQNSQHLPTVTCFFWSHQAVGVTCSADALRPGEYPGVGSFPGASHFTSRFQKFLPARSLPSPEASTTLLCYTRTSTSVDEGDFIRSMTMLTTENFRDHLISETEVSQWQVFICFALW